ncbi:MAG TPA: hypothetical protein VGN43_16635 [Steroidobacteraceae bacterium]|jgi:uncharacterized membrane protein YkoI|nr:hypothetical protein [Steroidobacteraceae bacterium]
MIQARAGSIIGGIVLTVAAFPTLAAWHCSIHPPKGATDAQLMSMAKLSKPKAERIALEKIGHRAKISSAEIEAEQECLIWSFDLKVPGHAGVQEVNIDAGNGNVLDVHHETASQESSEG